MRDRLSTEPSGENAGFDLWLTPFLFLNSSTPDFVARRFKEDAGLLHKIATSKSPDQVWVAYAEFWQKAMGDYGTEIATIMNLSAGVKTKSLAATQPAAGEGARDVLPVAKAA